jgi:hypothetical protein
LSPQHIAIRRHDPIAGEVVVHFHLPRGLFDASGGITGRILRFDKSIEIASSAAQVGGTSLCRHR